MPSRLGLFGAAGVWAALFGGVVVAIGDAAGSGVLDVIGAVLLAAGVLCFFGAGVRRSRREGVGLVSASAQSAKDALRLAWYVFKSA
jgi:hypothetical protein